MGPAELLLSGQITVSSLIISDPDAAVVAKQPVGNRPAATVGQIKNNFGSVSGRHQPGITADRDLDRPGAFINIQTRTGPDPVGGFFLSRSSVNLTL